MPMRGSLSVIPSSPATAVLASKAVAAPAGCPRTRTLAPLRPVFPSFHPPGHRLLDRTNQMLQVETARRIPGWAGHG